MSRPAPRVLAIAVALSCWSLAAQAAELEFENGWSGTLNSTVSLGTSVRAQDPDSMLFSSADGQRIGISGGTGGTNTDSGNLNYAKGDAFSTLLNFSTELSLSKGDSGVYARARAWYDYALAEGKVRTGNGGSNYAMNAPLSDEGFDRLGKFSGVALLDAYAYSNFDVADMPLQVRLGNQVINWGESLFIQGLNQINPVDLTTLRKPGTEVKDAFLPVLALSTSLGLGEGRSVEAFYQFQWRPANIDSCGTYFSPVEFQVTTKAGGACSSTLVTLPGDSNAAQTASNKEVPMTEGREGQDQGQFGVALRLPIESLDAELGLYAMQFSARAPIVSALSGTDLRGITLPNGANAAATFQAIQAYLLPATQLAQLGVTSAKGFWEYPNDIRMFGISGTGNIGGISVGAEFSHSPNFPAQINGNDILNGMLGGVGPMASTAVAALGRGAGSEVSGYDRVDRSQLQVNGLAILPRVLNASQAVLAAEAAVQFADVGDSYTGRRYGRAFIFGNAKHSTYTTGPSNTQTDGFENDGFVTKTSWGYRARFVLEYPGFAGTSATLYPSLSFSHDVSGYSVDGQFIEGRKTLGLSTRVNLNKVHNLEIGYVRYADSAKYDPFRDRDFYSIVVSTSF